MATSEGERVEAADEEVREIYARYGLAMYFAQVVEHAIVNWAARPRRRDPGGASLCTLSRFHRGRARAGAWRNGSGGGGDGRRRRSARLGRARAPGRDWAPRAAHRGRGEDLGHADDHAVGRATPFGGTLRFGASGVRLRRNNVLEGVTIIVPEHERAVLNDASVPDWGRLELRDLRTEGQVAQPWRGPAAQPGVAHSIACPAARQALTHRHASGRAPRRPARRTCHGQASGHG